VPITFRRRRLVSLPEDVQLAAEGISDEIARIHNESYGQQVESIRTHVLKDLVVCLIDITLLTHERTLLENGLGTASVRRTRQEFQEAISSTYVATVEHFTGRRVVGFISDTHVDPDFSVEVFRLAPEAPVEPGPPGLES
jgi:uncharacterized protein YbcI